MLLVHPGGPYWLRKDAGAWQIPKGEIGPGEDPAAAARREVREELGLVLEGSLQPLSEIRQKGGKRVTAFAIEHDFACAALVSNHFEMEWPPRSGRTQRFPEVSEARWLGLEDARIVMLPSQVPLLDRLAQLAG